MNEGLEYVHEVEGFIHCGRTSFELVLVDEYSCSVSLHSLLKNLEAVVSWHVSHLVEEVFKVLAANEVWAENDVVRWLASSR